MSHTAGMDMVLPVPDAIPPLEELQQDLVLHLVQEVKFQPDLSQLPIKTQDDEITIEARDRSAHVLRCLKVVYDFPSDVFFNAINLMDRFLTKMKAKQKHVACISVSAFNIAATQHLKEMQATIDPTIDATIDRNHLVSISQCRCTAGDLKRMSVIIEKKLEWAPGTKPTTTLTFLQLFNNIFHAVAKQMHLGDVYTSIVKESELILRLEMVACDGNCASLRPSEVALVLLCTYLDAAANRLNANADATVSADGPSSHNASIAPSYQMLKNELMQFAIGLQEECNISEESFCSTRVAVGAILSKYNAQEQTPYRQELIWRLSSRTAGILRPTRNFRSVLPVIAEHAPISSPSRISRKYNRKMARRHGINRR